MQINKFNPKIFSLFHNIPEKWKGKWLIKWVVIFILLLIIAIIKIYFELSDLVVYIIAGFVLSLCEFALKNLNSIGLYMLEACCNNAISPISNLNKYSHT